LTAAGGFKVSPVSPCRPIAPATTSFGDCTETGQVIPVRFNGDDGGARLSRKVRTEHEKFAARAIPILPWPGIAVVHLFATGLFLSW